MAVTESPFEQFSLAVVPNRQEVAVVPTGELDLASADHVEREGSELIDSGFDRVVIDLRQTTFLDSTGLRVLIALRNSAVGAGWTLVLVPGPQQVQRLFDITRTRELFGWRDC